MAEMIGLANSVGTTVGTRVTIPLAPSPSQRLVTSNSSPSASIVEVTRDGDKYITVDLTVCKDARAIRKHILSQFPIPSDLRSDFGIYLTEIGGITIGGCLDDEKLLLYRRFAGMASSISRPRFIIQRMGTVSDVPLGEGSMTMSSPWSTTPTIGRMTPNLPILEDSDSDNAEALTRFTQDIFSQLPNTRRASLLSRHRRTVSESHARSKLKRIIVMVTQDQVNYLPIDITHLTEAQSIRKGVLSGLPIPESVQSNFAIYYSTSNDFSKSTALDDNQLFVRCRRSGDEMGSVKLLVRRITTPSSSNTQTTSNRPRSSSTIIEPLRVSIPLSHPKPSSHSPSASGPSPRTESAPPLGGQLIADRLPTPNWNVADNIQSTNHRIQLHSSPQVLCPTAGRSRYSSLVNMPNRRNSDVSASPATLLALKFKSGYSTSALNAGAPRSAPNVSYTPDFHPLKGTTGSRETHIGFGTGTLESVDEGRRVQVKKLLDDLVEQPAKSLGLSIHLAESSRESHYQGEKGAINYQTKTKLVIDGLAISGSVGPSTASHTPNSASNDHGQGGMVCKIIDLKPIDNSVVINGEMPVTEILKHLHNHGCSNVTSQLGNYEASQYPAATGGFGEIYLGKLPDGRRIGLKCFRLLIDTTDDGHKKLKRAAHELYIWAKCQHPNILALFGVTEHRGQIAMVSPWMENGDLSRFLSRKPRPQVNLCLLCAQIADGVAYLHQEGIVHGDLKGGNVLISDDFTPKIIDFGGAGLKKYTLRFATTTGKPGLSVRWTAPEVINEDTGNTVEADVYSLAMTILEAISGKQPYASVGNEGAVIRRIILGIHPDRPEGCIPVTSAQGNVLWDLLIKCWEYSPVNRPLVSEVRDIIKTITPDGLR